MYHQQTLLVHGMRTTGGVSANRSELLAILGILKAYKQVPQVTVLSDSEYAYTMITKKLKGEHIQQETANLDLVDAIGREIQRRTTAGIPLPQLCEWLLGVSAHKDDTPGIQRVADDAAVGCRSTDP